MCLLGAAWLDILVQHEGTRSAWELVSPAREQAKIFETGQSQHLAIPGTILDVTSIQGDLALGLNNSLPLSLFGIKPLYPPRLLDFSHVDVRPAASTRMVVAIWWACTLVIVGTPLLIVNGGRSRYARNLQKLLVAVAIGLTASYLTMLILPSWANPLSVLVIAINCVAVAIFLCTPFLSSHVAGRSEGTPPADRCATASVSAISNSSLAFISFAVFSWAAIWLGWYTYDTRVNLLESAPALFGMLGVALSILALLVALAISKEGRQSWVKILIVALSALLITQAPLPPRQAIGNNYILLNSDEIVRYEHSPWVRETLPEQAMALTGLSGLKADEFLASDTVQSVNGFNSANLYSHIPVSLSWIRPFVMLAAFTALCAGFVFAVRGGVQILVSVRWVLSARRPIGFLLVIVTSISVVYSFYYVARQVRMSLASHGMARMLVLSPARIIEPAYFSYATYFSNQEDIPKFATSYFNLVQELDRYVLNTLYQLTQIRMIYFIHGAGDWMTSGSIREMEDKAKLLELANDQSSALTDRLKNFPTLLETALIYNGVEPALASASRRNWERRIRGALAFMSIQSEELVLHRKFISSLLSAPSQSLTRLFEGAVMIRAGSDNTSELPKLKLEGIRATLALENSRQQHAFAFMSENVQQLVEAGDREKLIRILIAYEKLLTCFEDPLSYVMEGSEGKVRWRDASTDSKCNEAILDVGKAQRGEL